MARPRAASPTYPARRRLAAVVLGIVGVAGLTVASAAQLNVNSRSLGAGTAVVASCQASTHPIGVSFTTTWSGSPAAYRANAVTLSGIDADCNNSTVQIQLVGAGVEVTGPITGVPAAGNGSVTLTVPGATKPTASSISSVAVVISS